MIIVAGIGATLAVLCITLKDPMRSSEFNEESVTT